MDAIPSCKEQLVKMTESITDYYIRILETGPCQLISPQIIPIYDKTPDPIDTSKMKKRQSKSQEESRDMEMDYHY